MADNENVLEMTISATVWGESNTKQNKVKKTKGNKSNERDADSSKIKQYICALLNSGGGKLVLKVTDGEITGENIVRPIEQYFQNVIGTQGVNENIESSETANEITLFVKPCCYNTVCTLDYNLYLPTDKQVMSIKPVESKTVKDLLNVHRLVDITETDKNVPTQFTFNFSIGIRESKTVQFKNLSATKSKGGNSLANRLINNNLTHYVSAFANYCGGRLYCGVRDNGIVEGVKISERDRNDVLKTVTKYINKMKWPECYGEPEQGQQWDITFSEVKNSDGNVIESTFVVVIFIGACRGGVFCKNPESYHIVEGEVKPMEFNEWKGRLLYPDRSVEISRSMSLCKWSNPERRNTCDALDGKLLRLINNGKWETFENEARASHSHDAEVNMVVESKWYVYHYRKSNYDEAEECLEKFNNFLSKIEDVLIFEVRGGLIRSALERTRGNHRISYDIAKGCLSKVEQISPCILTAEFYVHFATMLTIIEGNQDLRELLRVDLTKQSFKDEAIDFYDKAIQHLRKTDYVPQSKADMEQKTYINLAILRLGCSLSGDVVDDIVSKEAIQDAKTSLKLVNKSTTKHGNSLSGFRKCHHLFAQSSLFYRSSQLETKPGRRVEQLEDALRYAEEVELLATYYEFNELSGYARRHIQVYNAELQRQQQSRTN